MASKASRSASLTAYVVALDRSVVVLPGVSRLPLCDYGVPMLPDQMLHLALSELVDFRAHLCGRSGRLAGHDRPTDRRPWLLDALIGDDPAAAMATIERPASPLSSCFRCRLGRRARP